jgi:hypothetical protein
MASTQDRSPFVEALPARPNLEMQQKRAKRLLRAAWVGDADALTRIRALHPKPPAPEALKLADAQLIVARGYGFESWAAMKQKIDSLTKTPVEQFLDAIHGEDVERVRRLLDEHADVRAVVNDPISHFDSRPVARATKNLPLLDVLLAHGADLNLKSAWWAGGFGLLEYDCRLGSGPLGSVPRQCRNGEAASRIRCADRGSRSDLRWYAARPVLVRIAARMGARSRRFRGDRSPAPRRGRTPQAGRLADRPR